MRVHAFFFLATLALTTVCADQIFTITSHTGNEGFNFNMSGTIVNEPLLNVTFGEKITFRIEQYMENNADILAFGLTEGFGGSPDDFSGSSLGSLTPSASCVINSTYLPYAYYVNQTSGIPCILTWIVPQPKDGDSFYYTSKSKTFTGRIIVTAPAGGPTGTTSAGTGTGTGTPSGTGTPGTGTGTGTTPSSTGTGTVPGTGTGGKNNGAAVIVPGAAALIIAAINALFV